MSTLEFMPTFAHQGGQLLFVFQRKTSPHSGRGSQCSGFPLPHNTVGSAVYQRALPSASTELYYVSQQHQDKDWKCVQQMPPQGSQKRQGSLGLSGCRLSPT